jgi:protein-tyrosine kinase
MAVVGREIADQTHRFRKVTAGDMHIGQLLLRAGRLKESDIIRVVMEQHEKGLRFGDAALRLGLVSDLDVQYALARQYEYPYSRPGESSALSAALIAAHQPFGVQAEALRALRTQLMLRWFKDRSKVLAVVAPRSGAGSSILAANLAVVFAQLGERTLVIDANFRHPSQQDLFGLRVELGLAAVLAGRGSFKEAPEIIAPFENLFVLCAGPKVPNPQELLGRTMFSYVMETAPAAFDVVIVDCPPVLEYADAQLISAQARGCLLVTRRHRTTVADAKLAESHLTQTGAMLIGAAICE